MSTSTSLLNTKICESEPSNLDRRRTLRSICPCRTNSSQEYDKWRDLFTLARHGSYSERASAAHSLGTLIEKAKVVPAYRALLKHFQSDLDELMLDPKASRNVLGVMKKHGHAHKGAARKNYRKAYRVFQPYTKQDLVDWFNERMTPSSRKVSVASPGIARLATWMQHRVKCQPNRRTTDEELLKKAKQYLPAYFS